MLSTLITGLDGRSNFEQKGGASAPLPSPTAAMFAPGTDSTSL